MNICLFKLSKNGTKATTVRFRENISGLITIYESSAGVGVIMENNCLENHIDIYQRLSKNIGGCNNKAAKTSSFHVKARL